MQCKGQRHGHFSGGTEFQQVTRAKPIFTLRSHRSCHGSDELEYILRVRRRSGRRFAPPFYGGPGTFPTIYGGAEEPRENYKSLASAAKAVVARLQHARASPDSKRREQAPALHTRRR